MNRFTIFTDGASKGNPGPGGWGAIIVAGESVRELGGSDRDTTNNRMELFAAISALNDIPQDSEATVFTDSSYLINGITKWIKGWRKNNWLTKTKDEVSNRDLWEGLESAVSGKKIKWEYVGGHVGVAGNERCDVIATTYAEGRAPELYDGPLKSYALTNVLDVSHDAEQASVKKNQSARSRARAYSYVSSIAGDIKTHATWADCEKRVRGKKGARYKKALSADDEAHIIREFLH